MCCVTDFIFLLLIKTFDSFVDYDNRANKGKLNVFLILLTDDIVFLNKENNKSKTNKGHYMEYVCKYL